MIAVLKLDHRPKRDERITTHCALVARAFGTEQFFYTGTRDSDLEKRIKKVTERWGGKFSIQWVENWKGLFKKYKTVHLTMYGLPLKQKLSEIKRAKNLLIVVGGPKVPAEIYRMAKWNIAITNQPHSEIAALAIILYEIFNRKFKIFDRAKIKIVPQPAGKLVVRK
jgi:tRNA (cytidine56-2'-O)-methyltransferase